MKLRFTVICVIFSIFTIHAQHNSRFGVSLYSDYFSIPLSQENLITKSGGVGASYFLKDKLRFSLGFEERMQINSISKSYLTDHGILLGTGYIFWDDNKGFNSAEAIFELSNSLKYFSDFIDYSVSIGARMYFLDVCFLGTGLRYAGFKGEQMQQSNNLSWFWQLGLNLKIGKKQ